MGAVKRESDTVHAETETEKGVTTITNGKIGDPVEVCPAVHVQPNSDQFSTEFCSTAFSRVWMFGHHKYVQ
jgi:hypothetical protein